MRFESFEHMLSHWAGQTPDAPALKFERDGAPLSRTAARKRKRWELQQKVGPQ